MFLLVSNIFFWQFFWKFTGRYQSSGTAILSATIIPEEKNKEEWGFFLRSHCYLRQRQQGNNCKSTTCWSGGVTDIWLVNSAFPFFIGNVEEVLLIPNNCTQTVEDNFRSSLLFPLIRVVWKIPQKYNFCHVQKQDLLTS